VIKTLNFDLKAVGEKRLLQLSELHELRLEAYENFRVYKERTKKWQNKHLVKKRFEEGDMVLLFNSRLKFFRANCILAGQDLSSDQGPNKWSGRSVE